MEDILTSLSTYGYIILALYSFGGGMVAIIGASILSSLGEMNIIITIIVASISNMAGDFFLYYMGRYHKGDIKRHDFFIKHRRKMALSRLLIRNYDKAVIFIQKYLYGVKTLVPIMFGISNYNLQRFIILNIIASIVWAIVIGVGTYNSANFMIELFKEDGFNTVYFIAGFFLMLFAIWKYLDYKLDKRKK